MFAFAVYDALEHTLFLARDRFGEKPLYWLRLGLTFHFASEIKALLEVPGLPRDLDEACLCDYLAYSRTDVHERTLLAGVLAPAQGEPGLGGGRTARRASSAGGAPRTTWAASSPCPRFRPPARTAELFESAVKLRLRSDVPVGCCLSGGMDSSVLLGVVQERFGAGPDFACFTAVFPGRPEDESAYVDALAGRFAFRSLRVTPGPEQALEELDRFVWMNDEPTTAASFYAQYAVMRLAGESGVVVLLDGQGGDEAFAGYQYFHGFHMAGLLRRGNPAVLAEMAGTLLRGQDPSAWHTLAFLLAPKSIRRRLLAASQPHLRPDFLAARLGESRITNEFFSARDLNDSLALHYRYKLEHLLRMEDRNSMAFSLEARLPYLDHRLVEFLLGVPARLKLRHGRTKALQHQALGRYTVPAIASRRDKQGFETPADLWMAHPLWRERSRENLAYLAGRIGHVITGAMPRSGREIWKFNQLAQWMRLFTQPPQAPQRTSPCG